MKFEFILQDGDYIIQGCDKETLELVMEQPFDSFSGKAFKTTEECKKYLAKLYTLNESQDETVEESII